MEAALKNSYMVSTLTLRQADSTGEETLIGGRHQMLIAGAWR